jgi:hypothetical protein
MLYIKRIYPRKITKQSHFEFGPSGDTAFIFLKKTFSNIFITFADQFRRTLYAELLEVLVLLALSDVTRTICY